MIISNSAYHSNIVKVDECGYLMVCLCGKTCFSHITLDRLAKLYPGINLQLHVNNENGDIVPVTVEMLKP